MNPDGDITDAFDDDELTRSIEAGKNGPWNDDTAEFMDPKLVQLKKQLEKPKQRSYSERRLEELQRKAEQSGKPAPKKPRSKPAPNDPSLAPQGQWGGDDAAFQESIEPNAPPAPTHAPNARMPSPAPNPTEEPAPTAQPSALVMYAPSVFAATLVFVAATIVHGMLDGWQVHLIARAVLAIGVTGFLWRRFQAGRARAIGFAAVVYTVAFTPSQQIGVPENTFALFLGLLVVAAGSGLVGVQRDEYGANRV